MRKTKSFSILGQYSLMIFVCLISLGHQLFSQPLADGKSKFLGCGTNSSIWPGLDSYWNQVTPGNAGKWESVEPTRDQYNWGGLDAIYNYAISRGLLYKHHVLVWSAQQPGWIQSVDSATQREEVEEWIRLVGERYPNMDFIDVVNEPFHGVPSYGPALGGSGSTGWDWVVQAFTWARLYCAPGVKLILNEYNVLHDVTVTTNYIRLIDTLKVRGLIDGIGVQGHYFEFRSELSSPPPSPYMWDTNTIKSNLQRLVNTGLPVYITEFDIDESNDAIQLAQYKIYFPMLWNNPGVKGITLWGYIQSDIWGSHPYTYLLLATGSERPAMDWLRTFVEKGNFRSHQSGNWADVDSWEQSNGTTWESPASHFPTFSDDPVLIKNGDTITVTVTDSVDQVAVLKGGTLTIDPLSTFPVKNGPGTDLTVYGTVRNSGSIDLIDTATISVADSGIYVHDQDGGSIPTATWDVGSTCAITGVAIFVPSNITQNFYNFTWDCPYQALDLNLGWQNGMAIGGTLTVTSTDWDHSDYLIPFYQLLLFDGAGACTVNNIVVNGYNAVLGAQSADYADTLIVNGNITLSNGGMLSLSNSSGGITTYNVKGNFIVLDNAYIGKSDAANASKFVFNGSGTQNFTIPATGTTFVNAPNITVSSGSTLKMGTSVFGGDGSFQLQPGATLQSGHAGGINGNITSSGANGGGNFFSTGANYIFNGSIAQVTGSSLPDTVANLILNNSSGLTLSKNAAVNGTMDMQLGTLSSGGNILSYGLNGNLRYSSTLSQTTGDAEFPAIGGPKNLIINNTVSEVTLHASRIIAGKLSLTGRLVAGANTIAADSVSTSALTTAYVNVNGGGSLRLPVAASTQVFFPIGASGGGAVSYSPVWITSNGLSDTISVGAITDASTTRPRVKLKWNINGNIQTGVDYTLKFGWNPSVHESSTFTSNRVGNARIFLMTADTLEMGTGNYTFQIPGSPYAVMRSGITALGPFAVGKFRDSVTSVDNNNVEIPDQFSLTQNYPNPFNPTTKIEYDLPNAEFVTLKVYNLLGQLVMTMVNERQAAGKYVMPFDGGSLPSGIYIYRLTAGSNVQVKKMCLIK